MVLDEDLKVVAKNINENGFKNNSIMVTGATGLIGSLIIKGFLTANSVYGLSNRIYALVRNREKANLIYKDFIGIDNFKIIENEITQSINCADEIDYIFHTACTTTSKEMVEKPVELIKGSVCGTINILDFAKTHNTKAVVYLSSMEVYGVIDQCENRLKEGSLGFLDLTSLRSDYPESKRLCECLCKCYAEEYKLNVIVARLTQTFGAGVNINDNRLFAILAKSVVNHNDITLKTEGTSVRDYCYTTDAISAILVLAQKGQSGEVYNVANEKTTSSIMEMSKMVAKEFGDGIKVVVKTDSNGFATMFSPPSVIKLDTTKIRSLGWQPYVELKEMYKKLINYYKEHRDLAKI